MEKVLNASKRWVISVLIHRHSQMWGALASSTAAAAFGVPSATGTEVFVSKCFKDVFFLEDGDISIMIPLLAVPLSSVIASLLSKMMMIVIIMRRRRRRRRNSFSSCFLDSGHQSLDMS